MYTTHIWLLSHKYWLLVGAHQQSSLDLLPLYFRKLTGGGGGGVVVADVREQIVPSGTLGNPDRVVVVVITTN